MAGFDYLIPYALDWLNLVVRWLHVITGIAWIGASFYFVWLDNTIRPPAAGSDLEKKGVAGELWAVHGGGFYNPQKYLVAPAELPPQLHWFKWEAYSTWLSGFALLIIAYYFNAQAMMVDKSVADLASWQAMVIGLDSLLLGWTVYHLLCRSALGRRDVAFGVVMFLLLVAGAWVLNHYLSGRAAYIHVGAMTYRHQHAWLVLAAIMAAGVLIRHFFNLRHNGRTEWKYPAFGVLLLLAPVVALAPQPPVIAPAVPFAQVQAIVTQHCVACHADHPTQPGFATAPAGIALTSPQAIRQHGLKIYQQAVQLKAMPLANMTNMTDAERAQIGA